MAKESQIRPSRREMLTGLGAAGVGLAGATLLPGDLVRAADEPGPAGNPGTPALTEGFGVEAAPVTPGTRYFNIAGISLTTGQSTNVFDSGSGEISSSAGGGFFTTNLVLPPGARITEVAAYFVKNAAANITIRLVRSDGSGTGIFDEIFSQGTGAFGVSANVQTLTGAVASTPSAISNPAGAAHFLIVNLPGNAAVSLRGVRIGYVTPQTSFVPLTPGRVYDSRWAIFGGARIVSGENRAVSIKDRRRINPDDGAIDLADFVPDGASAISFNLGVAETLNQGFLAVTPGDAATFGAASINWFGPGQFLNNGTVTTIDTARNVKVFAGGGGQTHVIIDITGYYI